MCSSCSGLILADANEVAVRLTPRDACDTGAQLLGCSLLGPYQRQFVGTEVTVLLLPK